MINVVFCFFKLQQSKTYKNNKNFISVIRREIINLDFIIVVITKIFKFHMFTPKFSFLET